MRGIKVSPAPLDDDSRGIDILSHGIWHETTLAGIERKECANQLLGQIDVPILEDGEWPIPAFDNTRNNTLNRQNPVVVVLLGWISQELEGIRSNLVRQAREKRQSEMEAKLVKEAERISEILNEDFAHQEMELELTRSVSKRRSGRSVKEILDDKSELLPGDGDEQTSWAQMGADEGGKRGERATRRKLPRYGPNPSSGNEPGAKKSTTEGRERFRRAVFSLNLSISPPIEIDPGTTETRRRFS